MGRAAVTVAAWLAMTLIAGCALPPRPAESPGTTASSSPSQAGVTPAPTSPESSPSAPPRADFCSVKLPVGWERGVSFPDDAEPLAVGPDGSVFSKRGTALELIRPDGRTVKVGTAPSSDPRVDRAVVTATRVVYLLAGGISVGRVMEYSIESGGTRRLGTFSNFVARDDLVVAWTLPHTDADQGPAKLIDLRTGQVRTLGFVGWDAQLVGPAVVWLSRGRALSGVLLDGEVWTPPAPVAAFVRTRADANWDRFFSDGSTWWFRGSDGAYAWRVGWPGFVRVVATVSAGQTPIPLGMVGSLGFITVPGDGESGTHFVADLDSGSVARLDRLPYLFGPAQVVVDPAHPRVVAIGSATTLPRC